MIPIFRAKRLDSNEYVFGVPRQDSKGMYEMIINVVDDGVPGVIQRYIDITTLSIHFPDMIDSKGNKIFASLQEDGKGGDIILEPYLETERETVLSYENYIKNINKRHHTALYSKIIGIQQ